MKEARNINANNLEPFLQVLGLCKYFPIRRGLLDFWGKKNYLKAVDGVSFYIKKGETLVLIGESGCGKTTCGLTLLRLLDPTAGKVLLGGKDLFTLESREMLAFRRHMQIILQNPLAALDPRISARETILEPLAIHRKILGISFKEAMERAERLANEEVGLLKEELNRYPRELSGGQQQRVCICRALVLEPQFLVLDEPTSALDVSVEARVLNLLLDLRDRFQLTYLFITHDAAVARYIGDRVAVMYLGKIVELGNIDEVFDEPLHPYTKALMESVLTPRTMLPKKEIILRGAPESPINPPEGCIFQRRCREHDNHCGSEEPSLIEVHAGHFVSCKKVERRK